MEALGRGSGSPLGELLKQNETPCKDEALMPLRLLTLGKTDELGADIPTCRKVCAYFEDSDPDIKNSVVEYLRNAPQNPGGLTTSFFPSG